MKTILAAVALGVGLAACGGKNGDVEPDSDVADMDVDMDPDVGVDPDAAPDTMADMDVDTGTDGDTDADAGPDPVEVCTSPIDLYDTSSPDTVIGDGTPSNCTETALREAVDQGGVITFNCGPDPVTIPVSQTFDLHVDRDTIIDGGGLVTLDAQKLTRHFFFEHPDWMNNPNKVVLQRLTLRNGKAPAGTYYPQDPENPDCAYGYKEGSGGAIYMRNGVLHVIDCDFLDNEAALLGPDVGGGAIYVLGVPEVIIVGSRFSGNRGANAGAVGMLFANPGIYNTVFENNTAEGVGMNYVEPGCPDFNHDEQGGAGGNGGAIAFDGMNDDGVVFTLCGTVFSINRANELGGAVFRTPNVSMREMLIQDSVFDGNTGRMGGVSFIKQNDVTVMGATFMNNRSGVLVNGDEVGGPLGGLWINEGSVDLTNSTFYNNHPDGLNVEGSGGTALNATFVDSAAAGVRAINCLFVDTGCSGTLSGDRNLQWPEGTACAEGAAFADPRIDEIGDHGGPTPTFLPASGGAVEGVGADCPSTDQRGEPRNPASCAAGSVEP
jgi:hypothetical protein